MDPLETAERTHTCGALSERDEGKEVILKGWVNKRRDLGKLIFIDLRDRYGITQIVFDPDYDKTLHQKAHKLRSEFVIAIKGKVALRPKEMLNEKMQTGRIEVTAQAMLILNESLPPKFSVENEVNATEATRLKYRYLDLRRPSLTNIVIKRHKIISSIREYMNGEGFLDIETPSLTKSTPEGARDYIVPSRMEPGNFYALPQSPQLFKQTLMIAGFDKYYQIVKCFRDEDLRQNRQPEFTQLDIEVSFATQDGIFKMLEGLFKKVIKDLEGIDIKTPFPRISYDDAMKIYGTDKPDLRFDLPIKDLSAVFADSQFRIFKDCLKNAGKVKAIKLESKPNLTRKQLADYETFAKGIGAKGLLWIKFDSKAEISSPISKYLAGKEIDELRKNLDVKNDDLVFIVSDNESSALKILGELRIKLAKDFSLACKERYRFAWVVDFPLFEFSEEEKRLISKHHPFTSPNPKDLALIEKDPERAKSLAYDLILNGDEIGGGSIRIHDAALQKKIFNALKITEDEAKTKFGFLIEALKYGAPPHGGIALGIDRICMILCHASSIRDVIAFPKTQTAQCLFTGAPTTVSGDQLRELNLSVTRKKG